MDEENIKMSFSDFESVSINLMNELWKDQDFTDVTLATNDGKRQLKAHKVVLSSASDLFNSILRQHKHQNPLIFLQGIHLVMLEQVLEFIYTGKCEIQQENLEMFLSCGNALGIQRLAEHAESEDETLKIGKNKTEILSEAYIDTGTILALEKAADEDEEKMEHLQMGSVSAGHIKITSSEDQTDKLDECTGEDGNLQIGIVEAVQMKTSKDIRTKRFLCTICDYKTHRRGYLRDHESWHAGKVFKCNQCDSAAKSRASLKGHVKTMHGVPFSCTKCEFKSRSRTMMKSHRETMHEDITYKCDQCEFDTTNQHSLGRHKESVHVTRIKCSICSYSSKSKGSLRWHQQAIHEGLKIKCDLCDKEFNSPVPLKLHKNAHHSQNDQLYSCNECEFTAKQKNQLYRHSEIVHGTKEHFCEKCPYKTKVEMDLKIHIKREHLELYNFQCRQCTYSSKQKTHLDIHTKSKHEGEVLMCNLCNYKASQSSNLKRHQNTKHRLVKHEKENGLAQSTEK